MASFCAIQTEKDKQLNAFLSSVISDENIEGSVKLKEVIDENEYVAIAFGNSSNQGFASYVLPALIKARESVRCLEGAGEKFEVVYLNWGEEEDDKEMKMPFLSLSKKLFTDLKLRKEILNIFGDDDGELEIPAVALFSSKGSCGCKIIQTNCARAIYDTGSKGFPWSKEKMKELKDKEDERIAELEKQLHDWELLKDVELKNNKGEEIKRSDLGTNDIVAIYFSAHWCPPCRGFTPVLAKCYDELKSQGKKFEVIFASSDSDESSFNDYFGEMPWCALPYSNRDLKNDLSEIFGVSGIPSLIFLDGKGKLITKEGRGAISSGLEYWPWNEEQMAKAEAEKQEKLERKNKAAIDAEKNAIEAQNKNGLKSLVRIRGQPGNTTVDENYQITFSGGFDTVGAQEHLIHSGNAFYEVELKDLKNVQQFGFVTLDNFEHNTEYTGDGVGDDDCSWGADGTRQIYFPDNGKQCKEWNTGDFVGVAISFQDKTISFGLNGVWEIVFKNVILDKPVYPALTAGEGLYNVNFGQKPFKFLPPDESYKAVIGNVV